MKAVVFAYHNMGLAGLEALKRAGYEIACIFTHENEPDENCWFGSVKGWAMERHIPVHSPANINRPEWVERMAALRPDMLFSFYYRNMLEESILQLPPRGAYNLHGSLLPAYRGRSPVNWVLVRGETKTGVTLHHMIRQSDAGDIVGQREVPIAPDDTALTLLAKLCRAAGTLLNDLLPLMEAGKARRIPQDISLGSYFGRRGPQDGRIDWRWPAVRIYNLIRAVTAPWPGAFCALPDGAPLMVWWALPEEKADERGTSTPGTVETKGEGVFVRTGRGRIRLLDVETGGARMTADGLVLYFKERDGMVLS